MASMADKSFSRRGLGIPAEAGRSFSPGRLWALVKKEFLQIKRDSSTFLMGVVLPIILIIIMGFGMSLDVRNVPVAVVLLDSSPTARSAVSFVEGSEYFSPHYVTSMKEAEKMLLSMRCMPPLWCRGTLLPE